MNSKLSLLAGLMISSASLIAQDKIEFPAYDVYPEGIAYDATNKVFYVSGVTHATVGKVTAAGAYTQIWQDTVLRSTYGMKLDPSGKKLWIAAGDANYSRHGSDATKKKMIRLIAIDLANGKKVNDVDLSDITPGKHFANDLAFDASGNIYITDSFSPNIYKVDASGKAMLFTSSPLFMSANIGLNGILVHPGGYLLAVNSGAGSLFKVDLANPSNITKVKIDQFFPGADGLVMDNSTTISMVQNQSVNKIFKLTSSDNFASARVSMATKADALFAQPSTAVLKDKEVWVLNSKLNELADSMHVPAQKFTIQRAVFFPAQ